MTTRTAEHRVIGAWAVVEDGRLRVLVRASLETGETVDAVLPQREMSVILPRSLLLENPSRGSAELVEEIGPLVRKFVNGRAVRLKEFEGTTYCFFLSWRSVRFPIGDPENAAPATISASDG